MRRSPSGSKSHRQQCVGSGASVLFDVADVVVVVVAAAVVTVKVVVVVAVVVVVVMLVVAVLVVPQIRGNVLHDDAQRRGTTKASHGSERCSDTPQY